MGRIAAQRLCADIVLSEVRGQYAVSCSCIRDSSGEGFRRPTFPRDVERRGESSGRTVGALPFDPAAFFERQAQTLGTGLWTYDLWVGPRKWLKHGFVVLVMDFRHLFSESFRGERGRGRGTFCKRLLSPGCSLPLYESAANDGFCHAPPPSFTRAMGANFPMI